MRWPALVLLSVIAEPILLACAIWAWKAKRRGDGAKIPSAKGPLCRIENFSAFSRYLPRPIIHLRVSTSRYAPQMTRDIWIMAAWMVQKHGDQAVAAVSDRLAMMERDGSDWPRSH